jgi:hypothetical protein
MTETLIASSFLASSLLTMLVPIATFIAVVTWLTLVIRHHKPSSEGRPRGEASTRAESVGDGAVAPEGD